MFYQSASTVPFGIHLFDAPTSAISQTVPAAAVNLSDIPLLRTQPNSRTPTPNYLYNNKLQLIIISVPDPYRSFPFMYSMENKNVTSAQMFEVSLLGVGTAPGTVLRLEKECMRS